MLATKVTRSTARLGTSTTTISAATCTPYLAHAPTRQPHQRRKSSSKASCPPDSGKAAPTVASTASDTQSLRTKKAGKSRRSSQARLQSAESGYNALPVVPQLHHLGEQEFGLSSFFALHRPLSITNPLPTAVSQETFDSIFDQNQQVDPWADGNSAQQRPEDVVYALAKTIETIDEATAAAQNVLLRSEGAEAADGTRHLDGAPHLRIPSLEDIIAQARPYQVPPPPQAFPTESQPVEKKQASRSGKRLTTRTKSYTTTITVVESEHANGDKTYEASASPIVQLPDSGVREPTTADMHIWLPYRSRKRAPLAMTRSSTRLQRVRMVRDPQTRSSMRQMIRKPRMLLISVKRQRRLKMKKHKLKKLMRRTRNLRRRLENK